MCKQDQSIVERNQRWIAASKKQIEEYRRLIEMEEKCIEDLAMQNRELKGRE